MRAIADADDGITACLKDDDYETALGLLANLRSPLDAFFDKVTVNAAEPELRLQPFASSSYSPVNHGPDRGFLENRGLNRS